MTEVKKKMGRVTLYCSFEKEAWGHKLWTASTLKKPGKSTKCILPLELPEETES